MTLKFSDIDQDIQTLTPQEVAKQLEGCGAIELDEDERISEVRLECGCDLEIDIEKVIEDDPRCSAYPSHTETFTLSDIREYFTEFDYYKWAKDENDEDVLACFN